MEKEANPMSLTISSTSQEQQLEELEKELESYISTLQKSVAWIGRELVLYKNFWHDILINGIIIAERQIHQLIINRPVKALLVTLPKSGTTWLKALLFTITTRTQFELHNHPLMTTSPHDLVPFMEVYAANNMLNPISEAPILATHIPFSYLSETFRKAKFPIIYVYRNPKDVIVSLWHFTKDIRSEGLPPLDIEAAVDFFCKGQSPYGPYWDHLSEYWGANKEFPERVLFLSYEELMKDPISLVKRLGEFLGCPFTAEEEDQGVVMKIVELCGFESLRKLEVNKSEKFVINEKANIGFENKAFFREAKVGGYKNHLSEEMLKRLDAMIEEKLKDIKI